jgi:NitT/TauT family transport system substrate-binding protein
MGDVKRRGGRTTVGLVAVLLAAVMLVLAACGGDDGDSSSSSSSSSSGGGGTGPETKDLKIGLLKIGDVLPFWVAEKQGFFKDVGFTSVKGTEMAGGAAIQPAVQSGQLDLGWSNNVSVILAHTQKFDFKFFGGGVFLTPDSYGNQSILVKDSSPIKGAKDLEGKTVGVNTLGNLNELEVKSWLDGEGVDPSKVKIVELGTPLTVPPLVQGRVAAVTANEPAITIAKAKGGVRVIADKPFAAFGEEPFLAGWMSTGKWLDAHPRTAKAFNDAMQKSVDWIKANPDEANAVLTEKTGIPAAVVGKMVKSTDKPTIAPADLEPYIDAAKKYGLTKETFPADELIWKAPSS